MYCLYVLDEFLDNLSQRPSWAFLMGKCPSVCLYVVKFWIGNFFRTDVCQAYHNCFSVVTLKSIMAALSFNLPRYFLLFFPNSTSYKVTKNVPPWALKKCCFFLEWSVIQDSHPDLWLAKISFTSFPEKLHPDFAGMFH